MHATNRKEEEGGLSTDNSTSAIFEFFCIIIPVSFYSVSSSCFQVVDANNVIDLASSERLLDFTQNPELKELLDTYEVVGIEVRNTAFFVKIKVGHFYVSVDLHLSEFFFSDVPPSM